MDGLFINGRRPASKKAVREAITIVPHDRIVVERTSLFLSPGTDTRPTLSNLPVGTKVDFVGPDPYTSRKFYGRLVVTEKGVKVT